MPPPAMNTSARFARRRFPKSKRKSKSTRAACARITNGSAGVPSPAPPKPSPERAGPFRGQKNGIANGSLVRLSFRLLGLCAPRGSRKLAEILDVGAQAELTGGFAMAGDELVLVGILVPVER